MNLYTKSLAYVVIPLYTLLFTHGYGWFKTNFSVIGNVFDRKLSFLVWGILVSAYFYKIHRTIRSSISLTPPCARLIPSAILLLLFAITTPYLPEIMPFKSFLHIVFAFSAAVLLLLFLFAVSWSQYKISPVIYRPYLECLVGIVLISLFLLISAGIITSALEIFVTFTTVILSERLSRQVSGGLNSTQTDPLSHSHPSPISDVNECSTQA